MDKRLDDGVVRRVHVRVERERALSVAVVGGVANRRDDPVLATATQTTFTRITNRGHIFPIRTV